MDLARSPEIVVPSHIEIAGALQGILRGTQSARYTLDLQQRDSLEGIGSAIASGETAGYVEMATSTGKTVVASLLAEAAVNAGKRVLVLAPSIAIADQLSGTSNESPKGLAKFTDLHDRELVGHHYGQRRANGSYPVVISTYSGFLNDYKQDHRSLGHFDVVIADECHKSLGIETSKAMTTAFNGAVKIGLSATPAYAVNRTSDEVYSNRLYEFSLKDAIESGKTAPVRALIYETDTTIRLNERRKYFTDDELAVLIPNMERNGVAAKLTKELVESGRQGIVACVPGAQNLHARVLSQILRSPEYGGIRAADVGSHLQPDELASRLRDFEEGRLDVLTFTKSLEEGWDSDKASFCLNISPTESPVRTKQLLGRILRKKPSGIESIYVDFVDQKVGARKQQYTAMHALGLDFIDINRVIGIGDKVEPLGRPFALPPLSVQLMEKLLASQGKELRNVVVGKLNEITPEQLLQKKWEQVLAGEGMPEDLGPHLVIPKRFTDICNKGLVKFVELNGFIPSDEELLQLVKPKLTKAAFFAMKQYGIQLDIDGLDINELPAGTTDPTFDTVLSQLLEGQLHATLDTLGEREAGTVSMRYGLQYDTPALRDKLPQNIDRHNYSMRDKLVDIDPASDDEVGYLTGGPMRLDDIGKVFGVSRERARQYESKAMSQLRHPNRSTSLSSYIFESDPKNTTSEQKSPMDIVRGNLEDILNNGDPLGFLRFNPNNLGSVRRALGLGRYNPYLSYTTNSRLADYCDLFQIPSYTFIPVERIGESALMRAAEMEAIVEELHSKRHRIENRPMHPSNAEQRQASIDWINARVDIYNKALAATKAIAIWCARSSANRY